MRNHVGIPLIHPRTENLAVYGVLLILAVIGLIVLPALPVRIGAVVLLVLFALAHTFGYYRVRNAPELLRYFALQTLVVTGLMWLAAPSDAFNFLYFILGVQAMIVLPPRWGIAWIGLFYALDSGFGITSRGRDGIVEALFNVAVYLFTALFGYAIQTAEQARRRNQQLLADLQAAQEQVKALAVAEERNRLAREIHDGLGHYLTTTTMQLQGARAVLESSDASVQAPAALSALGKAETLLQEALIDVRRSVAALRTTPSSQRSVAETLAALVDEHRITDQLDGQFTLTGIPYALNPQVEMTLYRVAQEGLTNVHKHAQASHVLVTLVYEIRHVRLTIADNGQGCATPNGGYGLLGLRERVQLVGGTVKLHTALGQGFRLEVVLPGRAI